MLESLVNYYEYLCEHHPDKVASPGWSPTKVTAFLELDSGGSLIGVIPAGDKKGDVREVPKPVERSVNVAANLLCDNSSYLLGIDSKGKPKRALECFLKSKELHLSVLADIESPYAHAVVAFFEKWNPEDAEKASVISNHKDELLNGRNLVFMVDGKEVLDDPVIQNVISERAFCAGGDELLPSLVSGKKVVPARLHPKIKLAGAQAGGGVLVGFNAPAFTSYGHDDEQGFNSPVGEYEAFAYATALNYLIAQPKHHIRIEDTTFVYWALKDDDACTEVFQNVMLNRAFPSVDEVEKASKESTGSEDPDAKIDAIMKAMRRGKPVGDASLDAPFFVLGISPNAARISVRFFATDSFGRFLSNIDKHYERLRIVHAPHEKEHLSINRLVWEMQNPNAKWSKASNILAASLLRSVLTDTPYPAMLFQHAMMRIRSTQNNDDAHIRKVDYGRASIIKAYLIKNCGFSEEELTVDLNESNESVGYNLGRLFAVLERVQEQAAWVDGRTLNTTISDRYFNSACATPGVVFGTLVKLAGSHLSKLKKRGQGVVLSQMMGELIERIHVESVSYPTRLTIEEQGDFTIGYWCQRQEFFKPGNATKEER